MGYFSNGTEGEAYFADHCAHCVHNNKDDGCPVWTAHLLYSYRDCNDPQSILHILIPKRESAAGNEACRMFHPTDPDRCRATGDLFAIGQ